MLICENIACARGETVLFRHLGFCLPQGSLLLLKGPNGIGKTTLIKILAGLLPADHGHILWHGQKTAGNEQFKRELMYIGHKSAVKQDCTVEENVAFWAKLYGTEMLVSAALKFFDLEPLKETPASQLSAGWQRRVALARLIVAPCKLWLLDEPTNFLDDEAVKLMAGLIETRVAAGGIVVVASHIMNSSIAAHTLWLEDFVQSCESRSDCAGSFATLGDPVQALRASQD
jgi:heme exporter protein A